MVDEKGQLKAIGFVLDRRPAQFTADQVAVVAKQFGLRKTAHRVGSAQGELFGHIERLSGPLG